MVLTISTDVTSPIKDASQDGLIPKSNVQSIKELPQPVSSPLQHINPRFTQVPLLFHHDPAHAEMRGTNPCKVGLGRRPGTCIERERGEDKTLQRPQPDEQINLAVQQNGLVRPERSPGAAESILTGFECAPRACDHHAQDSHGLPRRQVIDLHAAHADSNMGIKSNLGLVLQLILQGFAPCLGRIEVLTQRRKLNL